MRDTADMMIPPCSVCGNPGQVILADLHGSASRCQEHGIMWAKPPAPILSRAWLAHALPVSVKLWRKTFRRWWAVPSVRFTLRWLGMGSTIGAVFVLVTGLAGLGYFVAFKAYWWAMSWGG